MLGGPDHQTTIGIGFKTTNALIFILNPIILLYLITLIRHAQKRRLVDQFIILRVHYMKVNCYQIAFVLNTFKLNNQSYKKFV